MFGGPVGPLNPSGTFWNGDLGSRWGRSLVAQRKSAIKVTRIMVSTPMSFSTKWRMDDNFPSTLLSASKIKIWFPPALKLRTGRRADVFLLVLLRFSQVKLTVKSIPDFYL